MVIGKDVGIVSFNDTPRKEIWPTASRCSPPTKNAWANWPPA
jgi:hypothetical protein